MKNLFFLITWILFASVLQAGSPKPSTVNEKLSSLNHAVLYGNDFQHSGLEGKCLESDFFCGDIQNPTSISQREPRSQYSRSLRICNGTGFCTLFQENIRTRIKILYRGKKYQLIQATFKLLLSGDVCSIFEDRLPRYRRHNRIYSNIGTV